MGVEQGTRDGRRGGCNGQAGRRGATGGRDQRGATLVMTVIFMFTLLLACGLALDFGRAWLLRTHLEMALDAAALSGALQAEPWVRIRVPRLYWYRVWEYCRDPETGELVRCGWHWESRDESVVLEGTEAALLWRREWRDRVDCNWPYTCDEPEVLRRWVVLNDEALDWARDAFIRNSRWPPGVMLREFGLSTVPARAGVRATARLAMPTSFLRLIRIDELSVARSATAEPVRR